MKALVAFGTRYDSTVRVAEEVGVSVLAARGWQVEVADLRQGAPEVGTSDLVVAGSCIIMGSWSKEAISFLQSNRSALEGKRGRPVCLLRGRHAQPRGGGRT